MRSRHSYAILKMLGMTQTIAKNEAAYVEIAVRLGIEAQWRNSIAEQLMQSHHYLYDDRNCVAALEAFYQRAGTGSSIRNFRYFTWLKQHSTSKTVMTTKTPFMRSHCPSHHPVRASKHEQRK